jgi:hypothetical protein
MWRAAVGFGHARTPRKTWEDIRWQQLKTLRSAVPISNIAPDYGAR